MPPHAGASESALDTVKHSSAAYRSLGVPLNEANHDVGGDEASPAREQYVVCLVLALRRGLAIGEGTGNAVHARNHRSRSGNQGGGCLCLFPMCSSFAVVPEYFEIFRGARAA